MWYRLVGVDADGSRAAFGPYGVSTEAPRFVRLLAPHPNPFNPHTTIRFELPRRAHASLRILDVRGRQVSVLADGSYEPGRHALSWNGQTAQGDAAASGVYFAELRAEGRRSYTRLVLVR